MYIWDAKEYGVWNATPDQAQTEQNSAGQDRPGQDRPGRAVAGLQFVFICTLKCVASVEKINKKQCKREESRKY